MPSFQGTWVPLVTPFQGAEINFAALRRLVIHLLESGVSELLPFQAEIQRRPIAGLLVPPPYYYQAFTAGSGGVH